jgi:hypothetical protein
MLQVLFTPSHLTWYRKDLYQVVHYSLSHLTLLIWETLRQRGSLLEEKHHTSLSMRVDILHHAKLVSDVLILHSIQRLCENVHDLLIYGYVPEHQNSSLHHVSDVMVFDLYMLRLVMKYKIL